MKKGLYSGILFLVLFVLLQTLVFKDKIDYKFIWLALLASLTFGYVFGILLSKGKKN